MNVDNNAIILDNIATNCGYTFRKIDYVNHLIQIIDDGDNW